jgi:hypothetical protein
MFVYWIAWSKVGDVEISVTAVEAVNRNEAIEGLMLEKYIGLERVWYIVEACSAQAWHVYLAHVRGDLDRYDLGTRMLINQICHQMGVCHTFGKHAASLNRGMDQEMPS